MKRKMLSLLLALCMVFSIVPVYGDEGDTYTITFDPNGGSFIQDVEGGFSYSAYIDDKSCVQCTFYENSYFYPNGINSFLKVPDGNTLLGWMDEEGHLYEAGYISVYSDMVLTAQYAESATVNICSGESTFDRDDFTGYNSSYGELDENASEVSVESYVGGTLYLWWYEQSLEPVEGKTFVGWMDEEENFYGNYTNVTVHKGMTLTAQYAENVNVRICFGEGIFDRSIFNSYYSGNVTIDENNNEATVATYVGAELSLYSYGYSLNPPEDKFFDGWTDENGQQYDKSDSAYVHKDMVLSAYFTEPIIVTIKAGEGGSFSDVYSYYGKRSDDFKEITYKAHKGDRLWLSNYYDYLNIPEGKIFNGWICNGQSYGMYEDITVQNDLVITADYSDPVVVTVNAGEGNSFNYSGTSYGKLDDEHTQIQYNALEGEEFYLGRYVNYLVLPEGKLVSGWADSDGNSYGKYDDVTIYGPMIFTPVLTDALFVTFSAEEGGAFKDNVSTYYGTLSDGNTKLKYAALPGDKLSLYQYSDCYIPPEGKVLSGWKDEQGAEYKTNGNITVYRHITLTPILVDPVTITINAGTGAKFKSYLYEGYGKLSDDCTQITYSAYEGEELYLGDYSDYIILPENKVLSGWKGGAEGFYGNYDSVTVSGSMTFTAVLDDPTLITLSAGEGGIFNEYIGSYYGKLSDDFKQITYSAYEGKELYLGTYSKYIIPPENKVLSGWKDGEGVFYDCNENITVRVNATFIAQYNDPLIVTISSGESSGFVDVASSDGILSEDRTKISYFAYEGEELYLGYYAGYLIPPEGKAFSGWKDNNGNLYDQYESADTYEGVVFTALFADKGTVILDAGDGQFTNSISNYYGTLNKERTKITYSSYDGEELYVGNYSRYLIAPEGKVLSGWVDKNKIQYKKDNSVILHNGMVLTAIYSDIFTVTFDAGDGIFTGEISSSYGSLSQDRKQISYKSYDGESLYINRYSSNYLAPPEGKAFTGWVDENDNYITGSRIMVNSSMHLTAVYSNEVNVVFNANGGRFDEVGSYYGFVSNDHSSVTKTCAEGTELYLSNYTSILTPPKNKVLTGWVDNKDNAYERYDSVYAEAGLEVTPVWTDPVYVTAYANGGTFKRSVESENHGVTLSSDLKSITVACAPNTYPDLNQYLYYLSSSNGYLPVAWVDKDGVRSYDDARDGAEYYCYWGRPSKVVIDLNGGRTDDELSNWSDITVAPDHKSFTVSGGQGDYFYLNSYSQYFRSDSGKSFAGLLDSNGKRYRANSNVYIIDGEKYTAVWENPVPVTINCGEGSFTDTPDKVKTIDVADGGVIPLYSYTDTLGIVEGKPFRGWKDNHGNYYSGNTSVTAEPGISFIAIYRADEELTRLAAPTDLKWNLESVARKNGDSYTYSTNPLYGSMYFKCPANQHQGRFKLSLYDADTNALVGYNSMHWSRYYDEMDSDYFIWWWNVASGRYYFTVQALGDGVNFKDSDIAKSEVLEYTRPEGELPRPAKPYWGSGENSNTVYFASPSSAYSVGFEGEVYYAPLPGLPLESEGSTIGGPRSSFDFELWDDVIQRNGFGYYYARVRYVSYDADKISSGTWSPLSDPYIISPRAVSEKLDELKASLPENPEPQDIINTVKSAVTTDAQKEELRTALLADGGGEGGIEDTIAELEDMTRIELEIKKPEGLFSNGQISVVGAKLNATEDATSVSLNIAQPTKEQRIPEALLSETQYKNTVQFVMDLGNSSKDSDGRLAVPVKIKMPVPTSINPRFLVLLHEHHDGTLETINWPDYTIVNEGGVWYVSFVVTDFSTFAFAQAPVSIREEKGTVTAETTMEGVLLMLAFYDGNGRMLGYNEGSSSVSAALPSDAVCAKAFVVGEGEAADPRLPASVWER